MTEKELKEYWYAAYARALVMLQHPERVTEKEIAACIRQAGKGVFNRLFCLVVWQEVKREKAGECSLSKEQYKAAITDVWRLFKQYSGVDGSGAYWDNLVNDLCKVIERYQGRMFIIDLAVNVTLEAIEDIWCRKEGKAACFPKIRTTQEK